MQPTVAKTDGPVFPNYGSDQDEGLAEDLPIAESFRLDLTNKRAHYSDEEEEVGEELGPGSHSILTREGASSQSSDVSDASFGASTILFVVSRCTLTLECNMLYTLSPPRVQGV